MGVHDAAVEIDFYAIDSDDARRTHEAEHILSIFERTAGYAFANLDRFGKDHFPDDVDRENLSLFMALQFVRGHDTANFQERFYTETSRMMMRVAAATPGYVRNFLRDQGEDTSDEAVEETIEAFREGAETVSVTPHRNETVAAILQAPVDFMRFFYMRRWVLMRSSAPFVTSDRPVVLVEAGNQNEPWRGVGLATADVIVFVLDRYRALFMQHPLPGNEEGIVDITAELAHRINIDVANRARRWVFNHPDDHPLDALRFNPNADSEKP